MLKENPVIGIAGLGLMGTAFALALREKCGVTAERLFACDKDEDALNTALEARLVSRTWRAENAGEMLQLCDLVFLCLNPCAVICFLEKWSGSFKKGSLVTDIAGIKSSIAAAAEKILGDFDFIPGHPMAGAHIQKGGSGGETDSFANSRLICFNGKNYILTPLSRNKQENLKYLKSLIYKMGFARITEVPPEEHDRKIAFTSQLCHVIAASLIDCEADTEISRFGGGSFEDLTRIAMLNAPMWTELFIENKEALLERIDKFGKSLNDLKSLISEAAAEELEKRLEAVKERRLLMSNEQ